MKIILAPDSFKGSLSAVRAAQLLEQAASQVFDGPLSLIRVPIADGGEGTLDAVLCARNGRKRICRVTGPLGEAVEAEYAFLDEQTALIEMAQAAGLPQVPADRRDPMETTTRGVGEMILRALDEGARRLLIGLGGSATNDGGTGMLRALGARFPDSTGCETPDGGKGLGKIETVDLSGLDPRLRETELVVLSDVTNPLLGETGATRVYGPQKGATGETLSILEAGMTRYARAAQKALGREIASLPGAGAAGGMGAALCGILGARMKPGIDAVLDEADFDAQLRDADLCVTGEGRIDGQSVRYGKAVSGIAKRCAGAGVPLLVIAGGMAMDAEALFDMAESSIMTTVNAPMPLSEAVERAEELFYSAAIRAFRLIRMGARMAEK